MQDIVIDSRDTEMSEMWNSHKIEKGLQVKRQ